MIWYNPQRKRAFLTAKQIQYGSQAERNWNSIFRKISVAEEKHNCDISEMSKELLEYEVTATFGCHIPTVKTRLRQFRIYIDWCREAGYDAIDLRGLYLRISPDAMGDNIRYNLVGNPLQLNEIFDLVFADKNSDSVDQILRAYLWLGYSGLDEHEALQIKTSDLNEEMTHITFHNEVYRLPSESIKSIKKACTLEEFTLYRSNERKAGEYLIRRTNRSDSSNEKEALSSLISRRFKDADISMRLDYPRIRRSGIMYRAFELYQLGNEQAMWTREIQKAMALKFKDKTPSSDEIKFYEKKILREFNTDFKYWRAVYAR